MIKKFLAPWVNLQNLCLDVLNTGIQETVENKPVFLLFRLLKTGIQETVENKSVFLCLDVLKTGIQETVENTPVFDPDFHTELIIKDEFEDLDSGNLDLGK